MIKSIKTLISELFDTSPYGPRTRYDIMCCEISESVARGQMSSNMIRVSLHECGLQALSQLESQEHKISEFYEVLFGDDRL